MRAIIRCTNFGLLPCRDLKSTYLFISQSYLVMSINEVLSLHFQNEMYDIHTQNISNARMAAGLSVRRIGE